MVKLSCWVGLTLCLIHGIFAQAQNSEWNSFTAGPVISLADDENNIWVGTSGGLYKFNKSSKELIFYNRANSGLYGYYVSSLAIGKDGEIWIGTWNCGLAKYDGTNWTRYTTLDSDLPSNDVNAIAIDDSGNVWIGTMRGLAKFNGKDWTIYNASNSPLTSSNIQCIAIDKS